MNFLFCKLLTLILDRQTALQAGACLEFDSDLVIFGPGARICIFSKYLDDSYEHPALVGSVLEHIPML